GDVAGLRAGNYGACLVGSVQGATFTAPADPVPVGTAAFFLVDAFDETGEGQVADSPAANPSPRCIPARRIFAMTANGDPGDGIQDGTEPLRNPSSLLWVAHKHKIGIDLHSGALVLSVLDFDTGGNMDLHGGGGGAGKPNLNDIHIHYLHLRPSIDRWLP